MNIFKRIANLFGGGAGRGDKRTLDVYALNHRCREPVHGQIDLFNELSQDEEGEHPYYTRKVVHTSGTNRCFGQVEFHLWFDNNKQPVDHQVDGGRWLEADEYAEEFARFNAPPEEESPEEGDQASGSVEE